MIHPSAIVAASAKIAENAEIGAFTIIGESVEIGSGTWVGPHVVINGPTKIGKDNKIFQFCSLGEATQALGRDETQTRLEIGDRNTIREYATINRGSVTHIGNDNLLMAYTHIAHDCVLGNRVIFANGASIAGHVHVEDFAILGGFTLVHQFCKIGQHSFSGLGSIVNRDIPPYIIVAGNHAAAFGINKEGLKRRNFSAATIRALHKAYMIMVKSHKPRHQALEEVEKLVRQHDEVKQMVDFILASERGIVRGNS